MNSVLFLYRHAIELAPKTLLPGNSSRQKLDVLGADLRAYMREKYQQEVPGGTTNQLKEIAAFDPNSMAFRYAEHKYQGKKACSSVDGEPYVGIPDLQRSMMELFAALSGAAEKMGREASL